MNEIARIVMALLVLIGGIILFLSGINQSFTFQTSIIFNVAEVIIGISTFIYVIMKGFN